MAIGIVERYKRWNWAWTVPVAWRYEPVIAELKRHGGERQRICDIGCGPRGGLSSYGGWRTIGVDLEFRPGFSSQFPAITPVTASAFDLPFATGSVKATTCLDVLEHLPRSQRASLVKEAFRVTCPDGLVFIGAPSGAAAREYEQRLNALFRSRTGRDHPWLVEHLAHEVITEDDLRHYVEDAAAHYMPGCGVRLIHNIDLAFWYRLTRISWLYPWSMQIQRLLFRPFFSFLARHNGPPSYRLIVIAEGIS
jgi:predicted SAM-dependent methyltransferase